MGMSSEQYIKEAITNIKTHLKQYGCALRKAKQPMASSYRPEFDITLLLKEDDITFYQSQISILRWMVELGRFDVYVNVAMLPCYLVQPRQGHLEAIFNIYGYLKARRRSTMVFDDGYLNWRDEDFPQYDWTDFYPDATEDIPPNAPSPKGMPVQLNAFVDADHAGNKVTRRSQTGILIYLNKAPIIWYSKAQETVETSTFGSEFVTLHMATELIKSLRYKLRMFGVPIEGPANVLVDNDTVVKNSSIPSSTLQKKHNSICYHFVREPGMPEVSLEHALADSSACTCTRTAVSTILLPSNAGRNLCTFIPYSQMYCLIENSYICPYKLYKGLP
jgi:hypothetical protein